MAKLGPGSCVGDRFTLIRKIGEGGMGEVYLAEQTDLKRPAVIKLIHPELSRDSSYVARFRREAQLGAKLTHRHLAAVYAFGEIPCELRSQGSRQWIAIEYIEGESLHRVLARDSPRQIGELLEPIADVLDRFSGQGMVHRDVKPDNILVAQEGQQRRAVLLDFGLAKPPREWEDGGPSTAVGVAVGSPTYMSPEQVFGPQVDGATDRYALGIILYIAVARRPPFRHEDRVQLVLMHKRMPVPAVGTLNPSVPRDHPLDQFFARALAKGPRDRFPTARQMIASYLEVVDLLSDPSAMTGKSRILGVPAPSMAEKSSPVWGAAGAAREDAELQQAQTTLFLDTITTLVRQERQPPRPSPDPTRAQKEAPSPRSAPAGGNGYGRLIARVEGTQDALDVLCWSDAILGTGLECRLRWPAGRLDRHHARLRALEGRLEVKDLPGSTGTFVNGSRVAADWTPLPDRAELRLGADHALAVTLFESGAALLRWTDPYHDGAPPALLLWGTVALGEPALGLVRPDEEATHWGILQSLNRRSLCWCPPGPVELMRRGQRVWHQLQPEDRLEFGQFAITWEASL